jgi:two-component system nitrogen regulation response regulator NtrX
VKSISSEGLELLKNYGWPGNVRELKNVIERLLIMVPYSVISAEAIALLFEGNPLSARVEEVSPYRFTSLREARAAFEREFIIRKLRANDWNISKTAEDLQIERSNLHRKIKFLKIDTKGDSADEDSNFKSHTRDSI